MFIFLTTEDIKEEKRAIEQKHLSPVDKEIEC